MEERVQWVSAAVPSNTSSQEMWNWGQPTGFTGKVGGHRGNGLSKGGMQCLPKCMPSPIRWNPSCDARHSWAKIRSGIKCLLLVLFQWRQHYFIPVSINFLIICIMLEAYEGHPGNLQKVIYMSADSFFLPGGVMMTVTKPPANHFILRISI